MVLNKQDLLNELTFVHPEILNDKYNQALAVVKVAKLTIYTFVTGISVTTILTVVGSSSITFTIFYEAFVCAFLVWIIIVSVLYYLNFVIRLHPEFELKSIRLFECKTHNKQFFSDTLFLAHWTKFDCAAYSESILPIVTYTKKPLTGAYRWYEDKSIENGNSSRKPLIAIFTKFYFLSLIPTVLVSVYWHLPNSSMFELLFFIVVLPYFCVWWLYSLMPYVQYIPSKGSVFVTIDVSRFEAREGNAIIMSIYPVSRRVLPKSYGNKQLPSLDGDSHIKEPIIVDCITYDRYGRNIRFQRYKAPS